MTIPALPLYLMSAALFIVLMIVAGVHVLHALRYGGRSLASLLTSGIFVVGVLVIVLTGWYFLRPTDLPQTIDVSLPTLTGATETAP